MSKKVISFSLYGRHPQYTLGAIANARHASMAYPGWICRFYISDSVPASIVTKLRGYGAEVINMGRNIGHEAMYWRLFAMVDPEVDVVISRDADSRLVKCEILMVNEWLASGKKFHVIRWNLYYRPIMGGLWGVRGGIPSLKQPLEEYLRLVTGGNLNENFPEDNLYPQMKVDEEFLEDNLYPQMKDNVLVHEPDHQTKRRYFVGETVQIFPPIAKDKRGWYLNIDRQPVGMRMPSRRSFVVLSIYKNSPLSEYFLAQLLTALETQNLYHWFHIRFYVADNIKPDLIKRLRRFGRVILKSSKTTHKDDPKYWKLSILSEKNLSAAAMVDFWQFFLLVRVSRIRLLFHEYQPIEYKRQSIGIRSQFRKITPICVSVSGSPVANIDELVAQRNPGESYQEFIRSTVCPRITTMTTSVLRVEFDHTGTLRSWIRLLLSMRLLRTISRCKVGITKN